MDPNGSLVTRQHVIDLLRRVPLSPQQERRLLSLDYPVEYAVVAAAFESVGVDMDVLTDRMGGSP